MTVCYSSLPMVSCAGLPRVIACAVCRELALGHRFQCSEDDAGRRIHFCIVCGAWPIHRSIKLRQLCQGRPQAGSHGWTALQRITLRRRRDHGKHVLRGFFRHKSLELLELGANGPALKLIALSSGLKLLIVYERVRARTAALAG